jgi:hypothetical protein
LESGSFWPYEMKTFLTANRDVAGFRNVETYPPRSYQPMITACHSRRWLTARVGLAHFWSLRLRASDGMPEGFYRMMYAVEICIILRFLTIRRPLCAI